MKEPLVYVQHIRERLAQVNEWADLGQERFDHDEMVRGAIYHSLMLAGEAAKRVSEDFRSQHPAIPWRELAGLRDILIHQYDGVDDGRVWEELRGRLPGILSSLDAILPDPGVLEEQVFNGS